MRRYISLLFLLLLPSAAVAQTTRYELTPFVGGRFGGAFRAGEQSLPLEVENSVTGGVLFDYALSPTMGVELLWSRQRSDVVLLDISATGVSLPPEILAAIPDVGVAIDYFHGAFVYGGGPRSFRPYILAGAGLARIDPDLASASTTNKFSFSLGTGFKSYFNERFGLRFDARAFGARAGDNREDIACGVFGCVSFETASTFWQGHLGVGLIVAF